MKKCIFRFLIGFVLFTLSPLCFAQELPSAYSPEVLTAFANDLYKNGFWDEAENEYKRSLFMWDLNQTEDSYKGDRVNLPLPVFQEQAVYTLTAIYNNQNNKNGITWLKQNYGSRVSIDIQEKIDLVNCRFIFMERNKEKLDSFTNSISSNLEEYQLPFQMLTLISQDVLSKDITAANVKATAVAREFEVFNNFVKLSSEYNTKNPALATVLSVFIPGSGKWYTGSFQAFLSSFLEVSSFVAGTVYTGIESNWQSWQPYVFGTVALILYSADIYGSYQSALRYNDAQFRHLCEALDLVYEELF